MLRNTGRLKLWFRSPKTLEKIGEKLTKSGVINSYHYDYENVSEWIAAKTKNADLELNFSRNHNEFTNFEAEWIAVLFMYNKTAPNKSHIHKIGLEISSILETTVNIGFISYIGGDNYKFEKITEVSF